VGKLCSALFGGGGFLSPLFFIEGLLLPLFMTDHQQQLAALLKSRLAHAVFSLPTRLGHNQGLLVLSKLPVADVRCEYHGGVIVHHMGYQAFTVAGTRIVNLHLVPDFSR
jgi:hypothetical protein